MKSKRIITFFSVLAIMFLAGSSAFAVTLSVGTSSGLVTQEIAVPVTVDNSTTIAGAAFTVVYDTTKLTLSQIQGDFFDTFANQWDVLDNPPDPLPPNSVTVDSETYSSPLVENKVAETGSLIAAARCIPSDGSDTTILFKLYFSLNSGQPAGTYPIQIIHTTLNNADAGYGFGPDGIAGNADDAPETIPILVGSDLSVTDLTDDSAFPIVFDPANGIGSFLSGDIVAQGSVTFTDAPMYDISGTISYSGSQTGTLYVAAFESSDTNYESPIGGMNYAWDSGTTSKAFTVSAPNGEYKLGAFIDSGGINNEPDAWEAQGEYATAITISDADDVTARDFALSDPVNPVTGEPLYYENWKTANVWTEIGAMTDDYDKDGYTNIQEYLNGTDPTVQSTQNGDGYDATKDNRVAPWIPITGNQYTMIVTGTAFTGGVQVVIGDWIGAFGPGGDSDCRAAQQVSTAGEYFLTVRGNVLSGETINFKLRRNSDMKILTSTDIAEFVSNDVIADKVLNFSLSRTKIINLIEGWNWVSFNVIPDDISLSAFFGANLNAVEQVKTQTNSMLNISGNWIGDNPNIMSKIDQYQMFKIKVAAGSDFTLNVNGQPLNPQASIDLQIGWSWIAYLPDYCLDVQTGITSVFANINQVKSQSASRLKINETTFIGDMNEMCPGNGYTIKMLDSDTLQYPQQP